MARAMATRCFDHPTVPPGCRRPMLASRPTSPGAGVRGRRGSEGASVHAHPVQAAAKTVDGSSRVERRIGVLLNQLDSSADVAVPGGNSTSAAKENLAGSRSIEAEDQVAIVVLPEPLSPHDADALAFSYIE